MAFLAALGASPVVAAAPNQIVVDGRTQTSVDVGDAATDIRTNTVHGDNAFNSFKHFKVTHGNTVNMYLPGGTDNLINLVHDSRAVIDGTLNGIKSGHIGGHIVFADPHGIVVGSQGVLNVGSLLLTTPTSAFMNKVVAPDGTIGEAAVQKLLDGQAPQAVDGNIRLDGTVNAVGAITIVGTDVSVSGALHSASPEARKALFQAAVNTDGIAEGVAISQQDGVITIAAAGGADINGTLDAAAMAGNNGGMIAVHADSNINIGSNAMLDASGTGTNSDGGTVELDAGQDLMLTSGAGLMVAAGKGGGDGGVIDTWADGNATVQTGVHFDASAGATGDGGFIEVSAAHNVSLDGLNADLSAGAGGEAGTFLIDPKTVTAGSTTYYTDGGNVEIIAGDSITVASGATINTRNIDDVSFNSDPTTADAKTTNSTGDSGHVLLQAPEIIIGENAQVLSFANSGYSGGDITLQSGDNFTCNICKEDLSGVDFDTLTDIVSDVPVTVASTNDVSIIVKQGAVLDASGYGTSVGKGGDITLEAHASDMQVAGFSQAGASVFVNGALLGNNVSVTASADAGVDFAWLGGLFDPANPMPSKALTLLQKVADSQVREFHQNAIENMDDWGDITNILGVLGLPVTAGAAVADAKVEIADAAVIDAANNVNIEAKSTRTVIGATGPGVLTSSMPALGFGVIYGHVSGTTAAVVSGTAEITAGNALAVTATSQNTMDVGASAMVAQPKSGHKAKGNTSLAFSAGIGFADVTTKAVIGAGAQIHGAGAVEVRATNVDSFTTTASSLAQPPLSGSTSKPQGGITAAVSLWNTNALAAFDAQLADGVSFDSLDVVADNVAETHVTKTTVQTGNNLFDYLLGTPANRRTALSGILSGALGKAGGKGAPKFAAAASITVSEQNATARIGEDAIVHADGDVTVRSRVVDQGIRSISDSRVNSTGPAGAASLSGSVAFAYAQYGHNSHAIVGDGAEIDATHIGVGARSYLPIDNDYDDALAAFDVTTWSGPMDFLGALNTLANAILAPDVPKLESLGLADYLLTGYSNAYGDASQSGTAIFGSANALRVSQDTRAWVGAGAQLDASGDDGDWQSQFGIDVPDANKLDISAPKEWTWSAPVDVDARTKTESVAVTGNLSLLTLAMSHAKPAGSSVGGSFGWNEFDTTTIAGIGDGAVVNAAALDVQATSTDHMIVIAPSAGIGKSMAGNGIFSYAQIDGKTHASISNGARINADSVDVQAQENINLWAIGGAVAVSSKTSVGVAIAANSISTDALAYVGDNSDDRVPEDGEDSDGDGWADAAATDVAVADGSTAGLRTTDLNVQARSEGRVGAIGVAAAVARSGGKKANGVGSSQSATQNTRANSTQSGAGNSGAGGGLAQAGSALGGSGGAVPTKSASSLSIAGSGTLNFSKINTIAEVRDANLIVNSGDDAPDVNVQALTHVDQVSASGSAAVSIGGGTGSSSAIAGALAFNNIDGETRAGLYDVSLAGTAPTVGNVDVLAASYGDVLSLGLGLAAAAGKKQTVGLALSLSVGMIDADTTAELENSDLTANTADDASVDLTAYDHSRVMVGGGALSVGIGRGGGGAGLAAAYGKIDDDVSAYVRNSSLHDFDSLGVSALGASSIIAGAFGAKVSAGVGSTSVGGSVYVMTLDSGIAAGITDSDVQVDGNVIVTGSSTDGIGWLDDTITEGGFDSQADFDGSDALSKIDDCSDGSDGSKDCQVGFAIEPVDGETMIGFAGSLAAGGGASAGLAIGYTDLQGSYTAEIRDSDVTASNGDVDVTALNGRQVIGVAVGASVSVGSSPAALGSAAITISDTEVNAQVLGDSTIDADHVAIKAGAEGTIYSLAGSLSVSTGSAAVGAAATYNDIGGTVNAHLGGTSVIADGSDPAGAARVVDVSAVQDADIRSAAISGSIAPASAAISGSATVNVLTTATTATLDANEVQAQTVRVAVENGTDSDPSSIMSMAGSLTASSSAGIGLAVAVNTLDRSYDATVSGTDFNGTDALATDELVVHSTGASEVKTLAASGGVSGNVAIGASDATTTSSNTVGAYVTGVDIENDQARVDVLASDGSSIDSLAGTLQGGGSAGVGVSVTTNDIANTVESKVSGGTLQVENLVVNAASDASIQTIAVGVAVGGTAGLAGSIAINLLDSTTSASISDDAVVTAQNNVGVIAYSDDAVDVVAGAVGVGVSAVGGGLGVVVNHMTSDTTAFIDGAGTKVSALALDANDALSVATGDLTDMPDVTKLEQAVDYNPTELTAEKHAVTGVAVNAQSMQSVGTFSTTVGVSASLGSVSGAVTANTSVVGGHTKAYIAGATINSAVGAADRQSVDVRASSHAYTANMALGLSAGGGVSATGTLAADVVNRDTSAYLRAADVNAAGAVDVDARTTIGSSLLSAGAAVGVAGVAGSGAFVLHDATTLAFLDGGADVTAGTLRVDAEADNNIMMVTGALGVGVGAAAAGAMDLAVSSLTTEATIDRSYRDPDAGSSPTSVQIDVMGDTIVNADTDSEITDWAVGGAVDASGVGAAVAGSVAANVVDNKTIARISAAAIGDDMAAGDVDVKANGRTKLSSFAGAASGGGVGIGAGAHISVIHATVNGLIENSTIETSGAVTVEAHGDTDVDATSVAAGIGLSAGISGALSVAVIGSGDRGDANDEMNKGGAGTLSKVGDMAQADRTGAAADHMTTDQKNSLNTAAGYDVMAATDESLKDTTTARISGGSITAGAVTVNADDRTSLDSIVGAIAVGGGVGLGGAVSLNFVYNTVNAGIIGDADITSPGDVAIKALALNGDGKAVDIHAYTGAAGLVGLGAAFGQANLDNSVNVDLNANVHKTDDGDGANLTLSAKDDTTAAVDALGAQVGAAAVGIVIAKAKKSSKVSARVHGGADVDADALSVTAGSDGALSAHGVAASAGIVSGSGVVVLADAASDVKVEILDGAVVDVGSGDVKIHAQAAPDTTVEAVGVSVGLASVGASVATAESNANVSAHVGSANITAGELAVDALTVFGGGTDAKASAGTGGLIGINATVSKATGNATVKAIIDRGATVNVSDALTLSAHNNTSQNADSTAITLGFFAAGANVSEATASGDTYAELHADVQGNAEVVVEAISHTVNKAFATAGTGGVVSGAAAKANTSDTSTTKALLLPGGGSVTADSVRVEAAHIVDFDAGVDSVSASLVGASGAYADNEVDATVHATVGNDDPNDGNVAKVRANNIEITARGEANKTGISGNNVSSGSGGVVNAAAAKSITNVDLHTLALVGADADLGVIGDWLAAIDDGRGIFIDAQNLVTGNDKVKLDAGGALAIAKAESKFDADTQAVVRIGEDARLDSVGLLTLASSTQADVKTSVDARTYGLAGAAEGISRTDLNTDHRILIEGGADLRATGDIDLNAGASVSGQENLIKATARTHIWNKTAIPVSTVDADAIINNETTIDVGSNTTVRSAGDVELTAYDLGTIADGKGTGMDLYRKIIGDIAGAFGADLSLEIEAGTSHAETVSSVVVDGDVEAGIYHDQSLTIGLHASEYEDGNYVFNPDALSGTAVDRVDITTDMVSLTQQISERLDRLNDLIISHAGATEAVARYKAEVRRLHRRLDEMGYAGTTVTNSETGETMTAYRKDIRVPAITVSRMLARPGNIRVTGDSLTGGGSLKAPGDATIKIINESPYFLYLEGLEIPADEGGHVTLNRVDVHDNGDINAQNPGGGASFSQILTSKNSDDPSITVKNTFDPDAPGAPKVEYDPDPDNGSTADVIRKPFVPPDIVVLGQINNLRGDVTINNDSGSIIIRADVNANALHITAGHNFVLNADGFFATGGEPRSLWEDFLNSLDGRDASPTAGDVWEFVCDNYLCRMEYQDAGSASGWQVAALTPLSEVPALQSDGAIVAANNVFINAEYLNINGVIQSGIPSWSVHLDAGLRSGMDAFRKAYFNGDTDDQYLLLTTGISGYNKDKDWFEGSTGALTGAQDIKAWYNAKTDRIELDGVRVEGGYMELTGRIMSTGGGKLRVLDGYGRVDIDNDTGHALVLRTIDTGRGVEGTIRINDTGETIDRGGEEFVHSTVFKRIGNKIKVYDNQSVDAQDLPDNSLYTKGGRDTAFNPREGLRYEWLTGDDRTTETTYGYVSESTLGIDWLNKDPGAYDYKDEINEERPMLEGEYLAEHADDVDDAYQHDSYTTETSDAEVINRHSWSDCTTEVWGVCLASKSTTEVTWSQGFKDFEEYSLRADYPIAIEFIGSDAGQLDVTSNAAVFIGGPVSNRTGVTTIDATSIDTLSNGFVVKAEDLNLIADTGIGGNGRPLGVAASGVVAAKTDAGDINVRAITGDLNLGAVRAPGDVTLSALGNIVRVSDQVSGRNITLTADAGAIGDASNLLRIDTNGGMLTAHAGTDAHVEEVSGNLRLNRIVAEGNVTVKVDNGRLMDANIEQRKDTETIAELEARWASMNLLGADAQAVADKQVAAYQRSQIARYYQYWRQVRHVHKTDTGDYVSDPYDPDNTSYTSWQQALHEDFKDTTFDPDYVFAVSADKAADIREGVEWTREQLLYPMSAGLFSKGSDTTTRIETTNIEANNVTLIADGIGNALDEDIVIDASDTGFSGLSKDERIALSTAEPDDVTLENGIITIRQRDDVDVYARGQIEAQSDTDIFLGGENDFNLYNVDGKTIRIKTNGSIATADATRDAVVSGEDVILESGDGGIGTSSAWLGIDITGKLIARAKHSIYLIQENGNLPLDSINSTDGQVRLNVVNGGLTMLADDGALDTDIDIRAEDGIWITTGGDVGSAGERLTLSDAGSAIDSVPVNLDVGGDAWLAAAGPLSLMSGSSVDADLDIVGDHGLTVAGDDDSDDDPDKTSVGGDWRVDMAGLDMEAGTLVDVGGKVSIATTHDASLSQISAGATGDDALSVDAGGAIRATGADNYLRTDGKVTLDAIDGIGVSGMRVAVDAPRLDVDGGTDSVFLRTARDVTDATIRAGQVVDVLANGDFHYQLLDAGTDIKVRGEADVSGDKANAGDTMLVETSGAQDHGILHSGGAMTLASTSGSMAWDSATGDTTLDVDSGGAITGGNGADAGGETSFAGNINIDGDGDALFNDAIASTGGNILFRVAGKLDVPADMDAAGKIETTDTGSAYFDNAHAGTSLTVKTDGEQNHGTLDAGGAMTLTSTNGPIAWDSATGDATLDVDSGGDITGGNGSATGGGTTFADNIDINGDGNALFDDVITSTDGDILLQVAGKLDVPADMDAAGKIEATHTGSAFFNNANAGTTLTVRTNGEQDHGTLDAGGAMKLASTNGPIAWNNATGDAMLEVDSGGDITGGNGSATGGGTTFADNIDINGDGNALFDDVITSTGGDILLQVAGKLDVPADMDAAGKIEATQTGSAFFNNANAGTTLTVRTNGEQDHGTLYAGDDMRLVAGAAHDPSSLNLIDDTPWKDNSDPGWFDPAKGADLSVYSMTSADGDIHLDARNATVEFGEALSEGGTIRIHTTHVQTLGQQLPSDDGYLRADSLVQLLAGDDITFRALLAGKDTDDPAIGGDVVLRSKRGDIAGNLVRASRDIKLFALNGKLKLDLIDAGGLYSLKAGRDIVAGISGDFDSRDSELLAGRNVTITTLGKGAPPKGDGDIFLGGVTAQKGYVKLDAAGNIHIFEATSSNGTTSGDVKAGTYVLARADGNIIIDNNIVTGTDIDLDAGGDILFDMLNAGGAIDSDSGGSTTGDKVLATGPIDIIAGNDISLGRIVSSEGSVNLRAMDDIVADFIQSADQQQLSSGGDMTLGTAIGDSTQDFHSGGFFHFDQLDAVGWINSTSHGDTQGDKVKSDTGIRMTAGLRDKGQVADPTSDADLRLVSAQGPEAYLRAADDLVVDDLYTANVVQFMGNRIESNVHDQDGVTLTGGFTGGNGGLARYVDLYFDTDGKVQFGRGYAHDADIETTGNQFSIADGWIVHTMQLHTNTTDLLMDNIDPTSRPVDVQLHELDKRFRLNLTGKIAATDAYVTHYRLGWQTVLPNYIYTHDHEPLIVDGPSGARDVGEQLQYMMEYKIPIVPPAWIAPGLPPQPTLQTPEEGAPVNLGSNEDATQDSEAQEKHT